MTLSRSCTSCTKCRLDAEPGYNPWNRRRQHLVPVFRDGERRGPLESGYRRAARIFVGEPVAARGHALSVQMTRDGVSAWVVEEGGTLVKVDVKSGKQNQIQGAGKSMNTVRRESRTDRNGFPAARSPTASIKTGAYAEVKDALPTRTVQISTGPVTSGLTKLADRQNFQGGLQDGESNHLDAAA